MKSPPFIHMLISIKKVSAEKHNTIN